MVTIILNIYVYVTCLTILFRLQHIIIFLREINSSLQVCVSCIFLRLYILVHWVSLKQLILQVSTTLYISLLLAINRFQTCFLTSQRSPICVNILTTTYEHGCYRLGYVLYCASCSSYILYYCLFPVSQHNRKKLEFNRTYYGSSALGALK